MPQNSEQQTQSGLVKKLVVLLVVSIVMVLTYTQFGDALTLQGLAQQETELLNFQQEHPVLVYGAAFLIYVIVTGLSLPGAAVLTLVYGWYFGLLRGFIIVSFSSTAGANTGLFAEPVLIS